MKILIHIIKTGQIISFIDPELAIKFMNKLTIQNVEFTTRSVHLKSWRK